MSMVRLLQHLEREGELEVQGFDLAVFSHTVMRARSETVLTLPKVSISTNCKRSSLADPDF